MKTLTVIACVLLTVYFTYKTYRYFTLEKKLVQKLNPATVILDVRTEREYRTGHIEGAVNIPLSKLHEDSIALDKTKVIVTCCSHGLRSVKAVTLLKEHGFKEVYNGGAWPDLEEMIRQKK
ncbi:sulfurtransferase [Sphingobacteriaceae bacterium]|nr:sulfurtransferase [Sphingobacteriaceae bacterium]